MSPTISVLQIVHFVFYFGGLECVTISSYHQITIDTLHGVKVGTIFIIVFIQQWQLGIHMFITVISPLHVA